MPGYKTHLTIGVFAFGVLSYFCVKQLWVPFSLSMLFIGFSACLLGSIFPDIDTASKMQRIFYFFAAGFIIYSLFTHSYKMFAVFSAVSVLILLVGHRTITHNFIFVLVLSGFLPIYSYFYHHKFLKQSLVFACCFCLGSLLHIFLDFFVSRVLKK